LGQGRWWFTGLLVLPAVDVAGVPTLSIATPFRTDKPISAILARKSRGEVCPMAALFHQVDLRLSRACKHLTELESLAKSLCGTTGKPITFYSDDWGDLSEIYMSGNKFEILGETEIGEVSVVIDDIVHNLRAALNYLIVLLARVDSLKQLFHRDLQFPIESSPKLFGEHRSSYLDGINSEHAAMIERVQPYNGYNWTKLLQTLSNTGKHLELVRLVHTADALPENKTDSLAKSAIDFVFDEAAEATDESPFPDSVTMNAEVSTQVAFMDGSPIIDKIHELKTQISNFIGQFKARMPLVRNRPVT